MRKRYVSINGEWVEITKDNEPEPRAQRADSVLWNDRAYQDLGDPRFHSRTQHREYMKQHGVTVAADFKEAWKRSEKKRMEVRQGVDPTRRRDIERAISQLNSRRK